MGQRLCLEIRSEEGYDFNIYFHWSGFTESTFIICSDLIKSGAKSFSELIKYFDDLGVYVSDKENEETKRMLKKIDFELKIKEPNRNDGLLSLEPIGKEQTRYWKESSVFLDFEHGVFNIIEAFMSFRDGDYDYDSLEKVNAEDLFGELSIDVFNKKTKYLYEKESFLFNNKIFIVI